MAQAQPVKRKPGRSRKTETIENIANDLADLLNQQDIEHHEKENAAVIKICTGRPSKQRKLDFDVDVDDIGDGDDDDYDGDDDDDDDKPFSTQSSVASTQPASSSMPPPPPPPLPTQAESVPTTTQGSSTNALLAQLVKHYNPKKKLESLELSRYQVTTSKKSMIWSTNLNDKWKLVKILNLV